MGILYRGFDAVLDRNVTIKALKNSGRLSRDKMRLLREAQSLAKLSHPNIVKVFEAGVEGNELFLAMEAMEGGSLEQWIETSDCTWRDIVRVVIDAALCDFRTKPTQRNRNKIQTLRKLLAANEVLESPNIADLDKLLI